MGGCVRGVVSPGSVERSKTKGGSCLFTLLPVWCVSVSVSVSVSVRVRVRVSVRVKG